MSILTLVSWFQAAENGDMDFIASHLHDFAGSTDSEGSTALIKAARNGHSDLVELLLETETRHINVHGETALLVAASKNHVKCCELLVAIEYDILSKDGLTALHVAARDGSSAVLSILYQYIHDCSDNAGYTVLDRAAMSGNLESIVVLRKLLSPDRKAVARAIEHCKNKEALAFLQGLYDDASQRYYGSMDDLSNEVDKLLSNVPSFTDPRLNTTASSFASDLGTISVHRFDVESLTSLTSSRTNFGPKTISPARPTSYKKESPKIHGPSLCSSSFSYSQTKPYLSSLGQQILHQASVVSKQAEQKRPPHHSGKSRGKSDNETQTSQLANCHNSAIQTDHQEDSAMELFRQENLRLVSTLSDYESVIIEKDAVIGQLEQAIEDYKQQVAQLQATTQQVHNLPDTINECDISTLTGSVINSRQPFVSPVDDHSLHHSTMHSLNLTQTSLTSTRRRHKSSKTTEALEHQIKELVERLRTSHEQLKRASQRELQYEKIKQRLIALSQDRELSIHKAQTEIAIDVSLDSSYTDEDKNWTESISTALSTISCLHKALQTNSRALIEKEKEIERLRAIEAKFLEQTASIENVDILHATIKDLHRQLEERAMDMDKVTELQMVKAELSSLQCKHDILVQKTANLEQNSIKRGYNESIYAEKLSILRDIQERGYLADPAYRVLLSRCEDLEGKLLESRKQNEQLTNEILSSKIKLSKLEQASHLIENPTLDPEPATATTTRPSSSKRVRIQSTYSVTPSENILVPEVPQSATEPQASALSSQSLNTNFFDQQALKQSLPTVSAQEIFKDSLHYTDMLTTTMLNTTKTASSMLQSNLYERVENDGTTPLMHAALENDAEKADKHMRYAGMAKSDGTTALMIAAEHNSINVAELLLKDEACMFREDGMRALDIAEACGNTAVAALLRTVEKPAGSSTSTNNATGRVFTELMSAAEHCNVSTASVLLKHQAMCKDSQGKTALMYAAAAGCAEIVNLLLDQESGMQDDTGRTALMYACMHGHPECVELLYSKEILIHDNKGNKPLRYAVDKASHGDRNIENKILEILCIPH